jgi:hypothetical protein
MQKVNPRDWLEELSDKKQFHYEDRNGNPSFFWYVERPLNQVTGKTILALHDMPVAFSEWWDFWAMRYEKLNKIPHSPDVSDEKLIVKVPLITDQECFNFGL